ncbi:MAG TPA: DUF1292 domain-containing protein [Symbiobacteriaceae bacterium]|nr:DUF1292 domain-containing protein [Symbiobacteriaceae bacterium]
MAEVDNLRPAMPPADGVPNHAAFVMLPDKEGTEHKFIVSVVLSIGGQAYAVLQPVDPAAVGWERHEIAVQTLTGYDKVEDIEDDELWERVAAAADAVMNGGDYCRICGCTDMRGCTEGCHWHRPGLCSSCVGKEGAPEKAEGPASP